MIAALNHSPSIEDERAEWMQSISIIPDFEESPEHFDVADEEAEQVEENDGE